MTYTYDVIQGERGPIAKIYSDGVEVDAFGPFEAGADAEAQAWAEAMVAGLSDGSVSLSETPVEDPATSARAKLAALGLTEAEIDALVGGING